MELTKDKITNITRITSRCKSRLLKNLATQEHFWDQLIHLKAEEKKLILVMKQSDEVIHSFNTVERNNKRLREDSFNTVERNNKRLREENGSCDQ